jgi:hypothetical protein
VTLLLPGCAELADDRQTIAETDREFFGHEGITRRLLSPDVFELWVESLAPEGNRQA